MDETTIKLKIQFLIEIENDYSEIKDYINNAKKQGLKSITINDDLHPILLDKLVERDKILFTKRRTRIFGKRTLIYWED